MDVATWAENLKAGIERAHSFRSPGHWDATTRDLHRGWHAANLKLHQATTPESVFRAAVSRELCAVVLRNRGEMVSG